MRHQLNDGTIREIPDEVLAAARLVHDWMRENLATQLCGLTLEEKLS